MGLHFPAISGIEGGGDAIVNTYGIGAFPTYILIAPDHDIVEQDMWPIANTDTFIDHFESNGVEQSECGVLSADFTADATEICKFTTVEYEDLSSGDITSWNWTFEGGDPATSTEQNPVVLYNGTGTFDVELEISDGSSSNSILIEDYIIVEECTGIDETEKEAFKLYPNPSSGQFDIQLIESGTFNITVYNILGKAIFSTELESFGNQSQTIDLMDEPGGVYMVTVRNDTDSFVKKLRLLK